ncbi:MAG: two-component system, OmpR family, phosphate regulon sensor histidine kinase PhoR [Candidatus Eremiobacteraeota bacterium]|jgi:two-component system sensor histidine kinase BaeS|nr:two-component system, OmpR family, phosphate regulon sensor histidine kinase PhoR [Candidatus Eremiobacteraeota bacterium]
MRRVIHEIRNHLAVAIANVEAFRDGVLEPTPKRLSAVLQALGEVKNLLGELTPRQMDPQPAPAPNARRINVCDVITNEVLAFEAAAAEQQIAFHVQQCTVHGPECANFTGDPVRVGEIVNNVVSNAIRYTPRGGQIDVDCRPAGGILTLTVTDGGPGVRSDELAKIFEAGFRGAASAGTTGSGEGLALVKRFVEEQGGTVEVENVAGRGARFTVRLPPMPIGGQHQSAPVAEPR